MPAGCRGYAGPGGVSDSVDQIVQARLRGQHDAVLSARGADQLPGGQAISEFVVAELGIAGAVAVPGERSSDCPETPHE